MITCNLFDLIDNHEADVYTPPPVHLQHGVSRSVVSVTNLIPRSAREQNMILLKSKLIIIISTFIQLK